MVARRRGQRRQARHDVRRRLPLLRNPKTPASGLANPGGGWFVGAYAYDTKVEQGFYGLLGDVCVVDRAPPVRDFVLG